MSQKELWIYIACGVAAVAGLLIFISMLPETRTPEFGRTAATEESSARSEPATPERRPYMPAPIGTTTSTGAPTPTDPMLAQDATHQSPGGSPAGQTKSAKVIYPPQEVEHLADTSAELRARIDDGVSKVLDLSYPGPGSAAVQNLIEIGKPAIPRILSAWAPLKMNDRKDVIRANMLDQVLRQITRRGSLYRPEGEKPEEARKREESRDAWFQWWGEFGAGFRVVDKPAGEE